MGIARCHLLCQLFIGAQQVGQALGELFLVKAATGGVTHNLGQEVVARHDSVATVVAVLKHIIAFSVGFSRLSTCLLLQSQRCSLLQHRSVIRYGNAKTQGLLVGNGLSLTLGARSSHG